MNVPNESRKDTLADHSKEMVAMALNEQGFLFQQVVRQRLGGLVADGEETQNQWRFAAAEYPVTAADGSQTRIDLLLKHQSAANVCICMECKRPNPKFKKWIFFDRDSSVAGMSDLTVLVETRFVGTRPAAEKDIRHNLARLSNMQHVPIFSYYVEAVVNRDSGTKQPFSSTEQIEKAFYQLMKGHSGLMAKFENSNDTGLFRSIPVVVTTAELFEVKFDPRRVSVEDGMISAEHLRIVPLDYCAVNYRADDSLALRRLTPYERSVGLNDLINAQIRTVFVVRATALNRFLNWAGHYLADAQ